MTDLHFIETLGAPTGPLVITFHGTGGDEMQLHPLAQQLVPGANVVSPRGQVREGGANRFFRRLAEGVYDMDDMARRRDALGSFIRTLKARLTPSRVIALGYSNGANIAAAISFVAPDLLDDLVLMHPLIPWTPEPQPGLSDRRILVTAGRHDPICPADQTQGLADWYRAQGAGVDLLWHDGGHEIRPDELDRAAEFLRPAHSHRAE
ncbi:alpha/beta hydrolase [Lutimaribacter sp. EGI FJ00015]|uniref:Alpha/beta hydrolase n=1 Tax=Lutimaribacter degradans TaxID=2945989 RepID=A0ACC5ZT79_9RHOB|nr:alpha/beta hydrolase [Lutimaribacter sp. EGI FJ00013]MCM2561544.1 alpha/beta hydrolase [Lutimaribacter sp. EGI FJ00013]MCO0612745.1 alpha/beta hydrolase [Lutimaribacter sp. EGI FJ00015]MCO0635403.1 alpha/beta hydrolase [Lutimaribacter sp. EGI FJ00014]